jgi:AcrR family transcriptional regulator
MDDAQAGTTGLRERKRAQTRRAIVDAALARFTEQGFSPTTVEQIAADAGIAPRTFFHYFPSKEDVVLADHDGRLARLREVLARRPADEAPLAAVRAALLEVADDYLEERDRLLVAARIMAGAPTVLARSLERQTHWEEAIAEVVAVRLGVDVVRDVRPRLVAAVTLAAMRVTQRAWLAAGGTDDLPERMADALDLLERGLGSIADQPV